MHSFALPVHTQRGRGGGVVVCEYQKIRLKINERDGRDATTPHKRTQRPLSSPASRNSRGRLTAAYTARRTSHPTAS